MTLGLAAMSRLQITILAPFVCLHGFWLVCGLIWAFGEFGGDRPPKSILEFKQRANGTARWYLNPFHDRSMMIWKTAAWITGLAWLAAGFIERVD
jgi:hypothetical protein